MLFISMSKLTMIHTQATCVNICNDKCSIFCCVDEGVSCKSFCKHFSKFESFISEQKFPQMEV